MSAVGDTVSGGRGEGGRNWFHSVRLGWRYLKKRFILMRDGTSACGKGRRDSCYGILVVWGWWVFRYVGITRYYMRVGGGEQV